MDVNRYLKTPYINDFYRDGKSLLDRVGEFDDLAQYRRYYWLPGMDNSKLDEPQDANGLYRRGLEKFQARAFSEAIFYFKQANALDPDNPWFWLYIAISECHLGRWKKAHRHIQMALSLRPELAQTEPSVREVLSVVEDALSKESFETPTRDVDEDIFGKIDLIESVLSAEEHFTMIEIGAGFGRWIGFAAGIVRKLRSDLTPRLAAYESEPRHFEFLKEHMAFNRIDCTCLPAAVSDRDGTVRFSIGDPLTYYGQKIVHGQTRSRTVEVPVMSLDSILRDFDRVDLIEMDIQGEEAKVINASKQMSAKVRKFHIGTHSPEIEQLLRKKFAAEGWIPVWDFEKRSSLACDVGKIDFVDGVQTWINPIFLKLHEKAQASNTGKYAISDSLEQKVRTLWHTVQA